MEIEEKRSSVWLFTLFIFKTFFQVFVLEPKKDLHGLGFDPFKNAPEFRGDKFSNHTSYFLNIL